MSAGTVSLRPRLLELKASRLNSVMIEEPKGVAITNFFVVAT